MELKNKVVSIKQLVLDPNNLRLDYDLTHQDYNEQDFLSLQEDTLEKLENENIDNLRESILDNGFLEIDRIVVRKAQHIHGEPPYYLVIEGNRRTAALLGIYNDYINGDIEIKDSLKNQLGSINVCCINTDSSERIEALSASLMGIRHVSGPKSWKGVQAAKLIYQLKSSKKSFQEIGSLLGIKTRDAQRRYEGYLAFIQMKSDDTFGEKCTHNHYALLLEFLSNKTSKSWLDWKENKFENKANRELLYGQLTKQDGHKKPEINSPAEARQFNRHLSIDTDRIEIEKGKGLSELPDLPISHESKVNHIKRFNSFINNISKEKDNLTPAVISQLQELQTDLSSLLEEQEG